jgi:hypothetical protein
MTPEQTAALLAYASAADPRIRRKDPDELRLQVRFWHGQLSDVDPDPARRAVEAHYRQAGADAILPGDVRAGARGSDATRHPSARTPAEALAAASGGRELDAAPADRAAVEAAKARVAAAVAAVSAKWATPSATGYVPKRNRSVGLAAARGPRRNLGPMTDRQGRALTVCHRCVADVPAPDGWDATNPAAPKVYCGRCQHKLAAERGATA